MTQADSALESAAAAVRQAKSAWDEANARVKAVTEERASADGAAETAQRDYREACRALEQAALAGATPDA